MNLDTFRRAADRIRTSIIRTPLVHSPTISRLFGANVWLKLENLQKTGSFKIRGATYKLMMRREEIGPHGVVAASAGNHAQGVALAAQSAGIASTIVMPEWASISKQEATRSYGGEVILFGQTIEESIEKARKFARQGKTFIHPFNDSDIITGQGTIGIEILEDLPDADMIIAPIGGGGLIAGVSMAAKSIKPNIRMIGVQAAVCPSALEARKHQKPFKVVSDSSSIADGISVRQVGELTFDIMEQYVDQIIAVEEEQIAAAILMLLERKKVLAEGAGAAPLAALFNRMIAVSPETNVVIVISGGNVDSPLLGRIINKGLLKHGRIMRVRVRLSDTPGSLSRLLAIVARLKANVLTIWHDRSDKDMPISMTGVEIELETRGPEHSDEIRRELTAAGYH